MFNSQFSPIGSLLTLGLFFTLTVAETNVTTSKVGWTGTLLSLDGGLGGLVTVVDDNTLSISSYTLKDASAPALYWWGTTDGVIKDGFRISNEQVTEAAKTNSLIIKLDAGKSTADFSTVGLWCERLSANFGQATLSDAGTASTSSSTTTAAIGAQTSAKSASTSTWSFLVAIYGCLAPSVVFATWIG